MAGRSRRSWFSVLLGLVVGFTLASRLILPRATELKKAGHKRRASGGTGGCGGGGGMMMMMKKEYGGVLMPNTEKPAVPQSNSFLFVGVMTAQKYLNNRAVAAYRYVNSSRPLTKNHHGNCCSRPKTVTTVQKKPCLLYFIALYSRISSSHNVMVFFDWLPE